MFLQELNEREQKDFLELATYAMKVDGDLHVNEINIINTFRLEMSKEDYVVTDKNVNEILKGFRMSTKKVKKIILMELFGVILADGVYEEFEQKLIEEIMKVWELKKRDISRIQNWVVDFNELVNEGYEYITS